MIKYLNEKEELQELVKNGDVLVDFYADWCGPCKMLGQNLEKIDFVDIIKINVDLFPELAQEYGVMSIPALFAFKDGEVINKKIGFQDLDEIKDMFND